MPVWKRLVRLAVASGVMFILGSASGRLLAAPHAILRPVADAKKDTPKKDAPKKDEAKEDEDTRKPSDAEYKAATTAIEAQLKAFKADDWDKAMKYQSLGLRENFESAAEFRAMMRKSYPQFTNYKSVTFGEGLASKDGSVIQVPITLIGQDRVVVKALYLMVREQGEYRVGSVMGGNVPSQPKRDVA